MKDKKEIRCDSCNKINSCPNPHGKVWVGGGDCGYYEKKSEIAEPIDFEQAVKLLGEIEGCNAEKIIPLGRFLQSQQGKISEFHELFDPLIIYMQEHGKEYGLKIGESICQNIPEILKSQQSEIRELKINVGRERRFKEAAKRLLADVNSWLQSDIDGLNSEIKQLEKEADLDTTTINSKNNIIAEQGKEIRGLKSRIDKDGTE